MERTLLFFAVFPGSVPIPMAVLDALVGLDEEDVDVRVLCDVSRVLSNALERLTTDHGRSSSVSRSPVSWRAS